MDAVEYLKEKVRMCIEHRCENCPSGKAWDEQYYSSCRAFEEEHPEEAVEVVKKWAAEHPVKTRQSEFLKMFPNARTDYAGVIEICAKSLDCNIGNELCAKHEICNDCRKEYWSQEVE